MQDAGESQNPYQNMPPNSLYEAVAQEEEQQLLHDKSDRR